ncbi:hypothetical protein IQ257_22745, partial [Coleofasciculus sp. LEGE 07092]|nr:hypothetical protein [Coleofasciculus sp. LEGE 07092]
MHPRYRLTPFCLLPSAFLITCLTLPVTAQTLDLPEIPNPIEPNPPT